MLAAPGAIGIYKGSERFSAASLKLGTYAALGAIDEEICILRLRSIPGPAKGFPLSKGFNGVPLGRIERPLSKYRKV